MADIDRKTERSHEYELGHTDKEIKRLGTQAKLVDPMTREFFRRAEIVAGMRVLDIGSGAGDVAFLAADLVGPEGEVIGTDRSPAAVNAAEKRAKELALSNVSFRLGEPDLLAFDQPFDAIVGRYVLMFSADPVKMLKGIAGHLRPGGVIVFHEVDWFGAQSAPPAPIFDDCCGWIVETFRSVGTKPDMGLRLHSAFLAAGLPAPTMGLSALVGGGSSTVSGLDLIADLAITMAPVMEQAGVTTITKLEPATLHERMRAEVLAIGSVVVGRSEIGAWARKSAGIGL